MAAKTKHARKIRKLLRHAGDRYDEIWLRDDTVIVNALIGDNIGPYIVAVSHDGVTDDDRIMATFHFVRSDEIREASIEMTQAEVYETFSDGEPPTAPAHTNKENRNDDGTGEIIRQRAEYAANPHPYN